MAKSYNQNQISYSYVPAFRKWEFKFNSDSILVPKIGAEKAHRIAALMDKSMSRNGTVDNLTKANVYRMI